MKETRTMAENERTSEEDLASLLPEEPEFFIQVVYEEYGKKLSAIVGKHGMGMLNTDDIKNVLQQTFFAVWTKVREPSFVPDRPLRMVFTIARNKAVDARRKKIRNAKLGVNATDINDFVISDMAGSDLAVDYRVASEEEKRRLDRVLPDIIAGLPGRQRLAVNAFLECYQEIREKNKHRLVADVMSRQCGENVDVAAAKSALREGMKKVKDELVRQGIGFVERRYQ